MNHKIRNNQKGAAGLIAILVVIAAVVAGGLYFVARTPGSDRVGDSSLPPASERVNPAPLSRDFLSVANITPGNRILVEEVSLSENGYVVVKRSSENGVEIAKSSLLPAGVHSRVSISTPALNDGEVVHIGLVDEAGNTITDENKNNISVLVNVGMPMTHYDDEY